ncbi:hypothetical protein UFOVP1254_71 [uncultured Caudovirales phage]|uniref:Uncharacterized protein n=1 Tax=uncultured Caudovirales phage TaxID=2100421 RepID=A0A6J5RLI1_9CAUD|nr:hypothetical protein UFOVP1254_71 [uncultured Caudovirales phage]
MSKTKVSSGLSLADRKQQQQYQAQDDLRTLQRAAEIQKLAARVKAAQREAQSQIAALGTVTKKK